MSQLSFFSADSVPPAVSDLTGLLATSGQIVVVGASGAAVRGRRPPWRADALAEMIAEVRADAGGAAHRENTPLVRTGVDTALLGIAALWTRGAVKTVPQWVPGSRER